MDDRVISKVLEADPLFGDFLDRLDGVAKMDDTSEVHVNGQDQKKKKALAGGLLLGTAAEGTATARSLSNLRAKGNVVRTAENAGKLTRLAHSPAGRVGEATLQTTNLLVGLTAAHELTRGDKQPKKPKPPASVAKGIRIGHYQPMGLVHSNARFRRLGLRPVPTRIRKGAFVRTTEDLVNGEHAIQAATMPTGRHRPGGVPDPATRTGRHRAVGATRKLTGLGKLTAITAATSVGAGGGYAAEESLKHRQSGAGQATVAKAADCEWHAEISKTDDDKRLVFGWASLSMVDGEPVLDRQGDYIPIDEAEDAAYRYMLTSRKGGDMHRRITKADSGPVHTADVVESMVFTPEKIAALGLEPDAVPLGWWLGMKVHDEQQWDDIKSGKRTGFSVHGSGTRKDMALT